MEENNLVTKDVIKEMMIAEWKKKYFRKGNHVYCKKNGHHKRCYLADEKWLCPVCDEKELETYRKEHEG